MKLRFLPPLLFLALAAAPAGRAADFPAPLARIDLAQPGPEWRPLFAALAAQGAIRAQFEEDRWFPFKKIPVVLRGEIRLAPDLGLSLHYLEPETGTLIVDAQGLLLRNAAGRDRALPPDGRAETSIRALLDVLRFDLPALAREFGAEGAQADGRWRLVFTPRAADGAALLSRLTVDGAGDEVRRIEMRRSALTSVDILIRDAQTRAVFTPVERAKFFR